MAEEPDKKALNEIRKGSSRLLSIKDPEEFLCSAADLYFAHEEECALLKSSNQCQQYLEFQPNMKSEGSESEGSESEGSENSDLEESTSFTWLGSSSEDESEEEYFQKPLGEQQHHTTLVKPSKYVKQEELVHSSVAEPSTCISQKKRKRKRRSAKKSAERVKTCLKYCEQRLSLVDLEKKIMHSYCAHFEIFDVDVGEKVCIHTAHAFTASSQNDRLTTTPIVLLHGYAGAIPTFYKFYKDLSATRSVYAIDMPGFGQSTRVHFPNDPEVCEEMIVSFIDKWRAKMGIDKMILLGHSLGGYFAAAYFLQYYGSVQHLVLLEPWGMYSQEDDEYSSRIKHDRKRMAKKLFDIAKVDFAEAVLNFGQNLTLRLLKFLMDKKARTHYGDDCLEYFVRQFTEQLLTGTKAFKFISNNTFEYPMKPLKERLIELLKSVKTPITFLYGKQSSIRKSGLSSACALGRPTVTVHCIEEGGHHIQVENPTMVVEYIVKYIYPNCDQSK